MKNKRSEMEFAGYLPTLKFVTTLSLLLTLFLLIDSFAQTSENTYRNQAPLDVEVIEQTDSPLSMVFNNVITSPNLTKQLTLQYRMSVQKILKRMY